MTAKRLHALFKGGDVAHGEFHPGRANSRGKVGGRISTESGPATVELWEKHLAGEVGLGVCPATYKGTICFGAIDIDVYGKDHGPVLGKLGRSRLPVFPALSKSGGLHVYMFFVDAPADKSVTLLKSMAQWLGFATTIEIFPKQLQAKGTPGNWINMPWFRGIERPFLDLSTGNPVTIEEFLDRAESSRLDVARVTDLYHLFGGPLHCWGKALHDLADGNRNKTLFGFGRYWAGVGLSPDQCHQNRNDVLVLQGLDDVGLNKPSEGENPRVCFAEKSICNLHCYAGLNIGRMVLAEESIKLCKYGETPAVYYLQSEGRKPVTITLPELMSARATQQAIAGVWNKIPVVPAKALEWADMVECWMAEIEEVAIPPEASPEGELLALVREYCQSSMQLLTEDTSTDNAWNDDGFHYYTLDGLFRFLTGRRFRSLERHVIVAAVLRAGHLETLVKIRGNKVPCYKLRYAPGYALPEPDKKEEVI